MSEQLERAVSVLNSFVQNGADTEVSITGARLAASVVLDELKEKRSDLERLRGELTGYKTFQASVLLFCRLGFSVIFSPIQRGTSVLIKRQISPEITEQQELLFRNDLTSEASMGAEIEKLFSAYPRPSRLSNAGRNSIPANMLRPVSPPRPKS